MTKKMLIDATHAEETRVVVVDGNRVEEFDFETAAKRQLAGNIYLAKVTRVEPSLQAAFVDYGGNRHGFLAFSEIHPDYYQIPVADRKALLEEEREYAREQAEDENRPRRGRRRSSPRAESAEGDAKVRSAEVSGAEDSGAIPGMDVVDLEEDEQDDTLFDGGDQPQATETAEEPNGEDQRPYAAVDHATEIDDEIESIADEDVSEEIRQPRKPRPRKYKIQEVIKVRQIMLVQVVKEERGNKGAALTTYLSLAGRYCVLMPNTARGGGISRKITNAADRKKLKEIAAEIEVPEGAGLIVRTAGAQRTKTEIKRDYEYLQRMWDQIRELTLKSIAPAPIYEEGNLIKRSIRDLYSREIEEVLVEGAEGYRVAKDFMKMIMPSHAKNVKQHVDQQPLFARYQVESYLSSMFNPTVQLKSGGYIVIGITEALVAIDVNSGRATKEGSIEETAVKTNLEAAEEIARQLRLRDLAGLIVIDFIDMEERKNNAAVEKKLKDKLKTDRARIQIGRISGFGLLEMSRQRLRPGMLESTTQPCPHCHGTGLIRSDDSQGLSILRQIEEEGTRKRSREVLLKAPVGVVNFLMNQKREHIAGIEARYGMAVRIEADPMLVSPDFVLEKFKTATRVVAEVPSPVVSIDTSTMPEMEEEIEEDQDEADVEAPEEAAEDTKADSGVENGDNGKSGRKRRRRKRRPRGGGADRTEAQATADESGTVTEAEPEPQEAAAEAAEAAPEQPAEQTAEEPAKAKPARRTRSRRGRGAKADEAAEVEAAQAPTEAPAETPAAEAPAEEPPAKPKRTRKSRAKPAAPAEAAAEPASEAPAAAPEPVAQPAPAPEPAAQPAAVPEAARQPAPEPEPAAETPAAEPEPVGAEAPAETEEAAKPRRRGWWSLGRG